MKKILIITGLTASGKSNLAIEIAKRYNGEIISADSVQIYKGLDIGSAKESKETMSSVSHHLIDIKNPDETYNVGEFVEDCKQAIKNITSRNKLPIIVGGTGLYIKTLLEGYSLGDSTANIEFREKYQKLAQKHGNKAVWDELYRLNPSRAESVHFNNLKRVIRYLEIECNHEDIQRTESILKDYKYYAVGIIDDREKIYQRINHRVDKMIGAGLEDEIKTLISHGATREMQSMTSIGYKEWFDYIEGNISRKDMINLIKQHTRNYCKRQMTFLKTIQDLPLLSIEEARVEIRRFLND